VVNFSDIYAMNARPLHLLVSIGISARFTTSMVGEIYDGIRLACKQYGVDLIGGDTTSSLTGMVLSGTVVGEGKAERLAFREGAGENDLICVSGDLGGAYIGLQVLERERRLYEENPDIQPALKGYDYVLERQLKPEARGDVVSMLEELNVRPTSMIDISDGLSSELHHICSASRKGCRIYAERIPVHPETRRTAAEFHIEPVVAALNGGEDYELLFTLPVSDYEKVSGRGEISFIGHITDAAKGMRLVTDSGSEIEITAGGWNGFSEPLSRPANP
jgi:thiamine-monophosphate kinase